MIPSEKKKFKTLILVLSFSTLIMVVKFIAWRFTGSNAILSDAFESIVNVVAGSFAVFSIYYSSQPRDENHPYGHGKMEFVAAGFEGGLVLIASLLMIYNAIKGFFHPGEIKSLDIGLWITLITGSLNFFMGQFLVRYAKQENSLLLKAEGKHLLTDTWSSLALALGLAIIHFTQMLWIDNALALVFGLFILKEGFKIFRESLNHLLDEADYHQLKKIVQALQESRKTEWIDIHNLRIIKYGSRLHVDAHLTLPWYNNLEDSHRQVTDLESSIKEKIGHNVEFFIHTDPCIPPISCQICKLVQCKERKSPFMKEIEWDLKSILPDAKHRAD
jgi:cation diffusion facilitator family transporter